MKFIKLESRGGNYLVVAENVAWLRTAENGQTSVGIVGGQPLLVVGSVEEVARKILDGVGGQEAPAPQAAAAPEPAAAAAPEPKAKSEPQPESQTEPQPEPRPQASAPAKPAPSSPPAAPTAPRRVSAAPPRQMKKGMTLAERVAAAAAASR